MFILAMADGRKGEGLSVECGLSGRKRRVGQENCRRLVCRDKFVAWVKGIGGGCGLSGQVWRVGQRNWRRVWSVGAKSLSGSRKLSAGCGLSAGVVCRGENVEWVKGTVARVWSVGAKMLRGSKGLSLECGLSA